MAISKELFEKALNRSKELFTEEGERKIQEKSRSVSSPETSKDYYDDSMFLAETYHEESPKITNESYKNSKMPDFIKESMMNNPIDVSCADPGRSVLDSIPGIKEKMVSERKVQNSYQPQTAQPIDYSLIKTIVEECVDRKLNEFMDKTLNESKLSTIGLKSGNIQLIDNKGKIFSAKLQYKGNINESKK